MEHTGMQTLRDVIQARKDDGTLDILKSDFKTEEVIMNVHENAKKPGEPIFIREDGKVGFPTMNSIKVNIGDRVKCKVQHDADTYFLLDVKEILS